MSKELAAEDKQLTRRQKPDNEMADQQKQPDLAPAAAAMLSLQQTVGNRAVQRLLAQRKGDDGFDLDDDTSGRINQARGSGQALDNSVQEQMSASMGFDFSHVQIHTSAESDTLNHQLNAKAFTTGHDIFFKEGEYKPGTTGGNELIAHELTHVVQQSQGLVGSSGSGMTVRPANDAFEQQADAVAKQSANPDMHQAGGEGAGAVQREPVSDEEKDEDD